MLQKVVISSDVTMVCIQHALSTEKEEIMGLLIGEVKDNGSLVSIVSSVILRRLNKTPDHVEISEEHVVEATVKAEELAAQVGRPLRVVGWYHSHPHSTVLPSHIDLETQSIYQQLDSSFVGIIFAVFAIDPDTNAQSVQITCFQSTDEGTTRGRREVKLEITKPDASLTATNFGTMSNLPAILKQEEDEAYNREVSQGDDDDIVNKLENDAVRTIAVGHIVEKLSRPMLESLVARNALNEVRLAALQEQHKQLTARIESINHNHHH